MTSQQTNNKIELPQVEYNNLIKYYIFLILFKASLLQIKHKILGIPSMQKDQSKKEFFKTIIEKRFRIF